MTENQSLTQECGRDGAFDAQREISAAPAPIPGTSKEFKAWWAGHSADAPAELHIAAGRAFLTLQSIEMNREPFKSRAVTELSAQALDDFARLWGTHTKGGR